MLKNNTKLVACVKFGFTQLLKPATVLKMTFNGDDLTTKGDIFYFCASFTSAKNDKYNYLFIKGRIITLKPGD